MTEKSDEQSAPGRLFFDGTCSFCVRWINRVRKPLNRRGIETVPFDDGGSETEMRLLLPDGREFGGADAIIFLSGRIWWASPLWIAAAIPGIRPLLHRAYRHVAANRHCLNGACTLDPETVSPAPQANRKVHAHFIKCAWAPTLLGWLVLLLLTSLAWLVGTALPIEGGWAADQTRLSQELPAWLWMWLLAGAMWAGFKLMAWLRIGGWPALGPRSFAFAAWVGMDAGSFAEKKTGRKLPIPGAFARLVTGALLIGMATPAIDSAVIRGWLGMSAILLFLHFGVFGIVAAFWNRLGFYVRPIMDAPWRARTLGEFWGERWNRAFSDLAGSAIFRPLVRRLGLITGTMAGFAFSGLAHELVISVPAGGGYGLPTAYFLIQGFGVLAERKFRLRGTAAGRVFLWLIILGPAFWLFHPAFMTAVIDPFLDFLTFTNR